ncbi:MAG: 5'/3'-nucleotidase SurE [Desulfovibrionaceae bacterium]|nr:5'/3'-nucleotidase SurE [Desulfovibrionaceae bacterium]
MDILLTNDDGIQALGLRALYRALTRAGHRVHVVAPVTEQSAVGHAVTMSLPLRVREFSESDFFGLGVSGTPADCVKLGLTTLLDQPPDLVVSGINSGANVGVDILYSGTVSAATEGALMSVPALAVSVDDFKPRDLSGQAEYCAGLIPGIPWAEVPEKTILNLNFPSCPVAQAGPLVVCPHTRVSYRDWYVERLDPRGNPYYWLEGVIPPDRISPGKDRALLSQGHVTLTPLRFDFNDQATLDLLRARLGLD